MDKAGARQARGESKAAAGAADPDQAERFIEAARELGCEDNLARFDEAVKRIGKARPAPREPRNAKTESHG